MIRLRRTVLWTAVFALGTASGMCPAQEAAPVTPETSAATEAQAPADAPQEPESADAIPVVPEPSEPSEAAPSVSAEVTEEASPPEAPAPPKKVNALSSPIVELEESFASGDLEAAVDALERAVGPWGWSPHPQLAHLEVTGLRLAQTLAESERPSAAIRVLSALGRAGRNPVNYLYRLQEDLAPELRAKLWPEQPYLILTDFRHRPEKVFKRSLDAQNRETVASTLDTEAAQARIELGPSVLGGRCWYTLPTTGLEVSAKPFRLTAAVHCEPACVPHLILRFWLDDTKTTASMIVENSEEGPDGWRHFDTDTESLYVWEQIKWTSGATAKDPSVLDIGIDLPEGPALTCLVKDIRIALPVNWQELPERPVEADLPPDRYVPLKTALPETASSLEEAIEQLEAIGYVGSTKVPAARAAQFVYHDSARAFQGHTLYTSAHEAVACLIDMDGKEVHRWTGDYEALWEGEVPPGAHKQRNWRHVRLLEDGGLLAIHEGRALLRLDKDSKVLWAKLEGFHHDLDVTGDGRIYALKREAKVIPRLHDRDPVLEDSLAVLGPDGEEIQSLSLLECFERSDYAPMFSGRLKKSGDIFHTNTVEVLDGRLAERCAAFKKGNVLVSPRELECIAVVDPEQKKVVWALSGMWLQQHSPTVLDNGHMLLFDNLGLFSARRGGERASRVIEFDPFTQEVAWEYRGTREAPFFTATSGLCQRLPNGNTLITETQRGRIFEVTKEGDVVWEMYNPHRVGERGHFLATVHVGMRIGPDFPLSWLAL